MVVRCTCSCRLNRVVGRTRRALSPRPINISDHLFNHLNQIRRYEFFNQSLYKSHAYPCCPIYTYLTRKAPHVATSRSYFHAETWRDFSSEQLLRLIPKDENVGTTSKTQNSLSKRHQLSKRYTSVLSTDLAIVGQLRPSETASIECKQNTRNMTWRK